MAAWLVMHSNWLKAQTIHSSELLHLHWQKCPKSCKSSLSGKHKLHFCRSRWSCAFVAFFGLFWSHFSHCHGTSAVASCCSHLRRNSCVWDCSLQPSAGVWRTDLGYEVNALKWSVRVQSQLILIARIWRKNRSWNITQTRTFEKINASRE